MRRRWCVRINCYKWYGKHRLRKTTVTTRTLACRQADVSILRVVTAAMRRQLDAPRSSRRFHSSIPFQGRT